MTLTLNTHRPQVVEKIVDKAFPHPIEPALPDAQVRKLIETGAFRAYHVHHGLRFMSSEISSELIKLLGPFINPVLRSILPDTFCAQCATPSY